jgi:hypothetical protein
MGSDDVSIGLSCWDGSVKVYFLKLDLFRS